MDSHQKFCKDLGNKSYTRFEYTEADREIREALKMGIEEYNNTKDERANEAKAMRGVTVAQHNSDLKKLKNFRKIRESNNSSKDLEK